MHSVSYFDVHVSDPTSALDFYSRVLARDSSRSIPFIEYWQIVTEGICGGLLKRPVADFGAIANYN